MRCVDCGTEWTGDGGAAWRAIVFDADDVDYLCPECQGVPVAERSR